MITTKIQRLDNEDEDEDEDTEEVDDGYQSVHPNHYLTKDDQHYTQWLMRGGIVLFIASRWHMARQR